MAKLITPLVPKQIDNARPKDKPYTLFDGGGLYLEISPSGSKLWKMKWGLHQRKGHGNQFQRLIIKCSAILTA